MKGGVSTPALPSPLSLNIYIHIYIFIWHHKGVLPLPPRGAGEPSPKGLGGGQGRCEGSGLGVGSSLWQLMSLERLDSGPRGHTRNPSQVVTDFLPSLPWRQRWGGGCIDPKGGGGETASSPTSLDCSHLETVPGKSPLTAALEPGQGQGLYARHLGVHHSQAGGAPRGTEQQEACPSPK